MISNGHSHDRVLPYRERKNINLLRLRKLKEKMNYSGKHADVSSAREHNIKTIEEISYEEIISKTKHIH